jgi:hypothetical protein
MWFKKIGLLASKAILVLFALFGIYATFMIVSSLSRLEDFFSDHNIEVIQMERSVYGEIASNRELSLKSKYPDYKEFCVYEPSVDPKKVISKSIHSDKNYNIKSNIGPLFLYDNDWYISFRDKEDSYLIIRMNAAAFPFSGFSTCGENINIYFDETSRSYKLN